MGNFSEYRTFLGNHQPLCKYFQCFLLNSIHDPFPFSPSIITHSAVAAQLRAPQNAMVISKKSLDVMAHPEAEWPSQQNIPIFYFFLFHYFLVPLADCKG